MVNGVSRAIKESKAKKFYVCNIMTEPGMTDNYSVADHVNAIVEHCGEGIIDYCLYDTGEVVPEYIKKYNLDGADLVEQDFKNIKERRIKFIKENLSVIKDGCVRHNANLIADIVIQVICDDLKFMDRQNEPEYMMMNSKLKADKEINKQKKKKVKSKKKNKNKNKGRFKSKFASKYQDRIESIKNTDRNIEKNKAEIADKTQDKDSNQTNINENLEKNVDLNKENEIENNNISIGEIKIKNYEEIRKEMLKKFNKGKK